MGCDDEDIWQDRERDSVPLNLTSAYNLEYPSHGSPIDRLAFVASRSSGIESLDLDYFACWPHTYRPRSSSLSALGNPSSSPSGTSTSPHPLQPKDARDLEAFLTLPK